DIYSLGCTLYYSVCGKVPFPGGDTTSKLRRHLEETPWHPRRFAIDITEDFVDIIADMMEKDISKRIANAAEVAARLEPWAIAELNVGSMGLSRSPWMAPPPPSHDQDKRFAEEAASDTQSLALAQATWSQSSDSEAPVWQANNDEASAPVRPTDQPQPLAEFNSTGSASSIRTSDPSALRPSTEANGSKLSTAMIIALTIAIAVPPTLLLGAILGYLAAQ
ncbi:MAG: serine/threonine protein kinase, partial [Aureliella sp.]